MEFTSDFTGDFRAASVAEYVLTGELGFRAIPRSAKIDGGYRVINGHGEVQVRRERASPTPPSDARAGLVTQPTPPRRTPRLRAMCGRCSPTQSTR